MKITFTFDTENEQDREDFEIFSKSQDMNLALYDIKQALRSLYKYDNKHDYDTIEHIYELVCDKIGNLDD